MSIFVYLSVIIAYADCLISSANGVTLNIAFLPVMFLLSYIVLHNYIREGCRYRFTVFISLALMWIRMVLLPVYGIHSGIYGLPTNTYENYSVILCCYDCLVVSAVLFFVSAHFQIRNKIVLHKRRQLILHGSNKVYIAIAIIALFVYITIGRHMSLFEFGFKTIGEDIDRVGDIVDTRTMVVRLIVRSGYLYLFFVLVGYYRNLYYRKRNVKYLTYSLALAAMMVCVIVGERRSSQIYIAFSCIMLLSSLYPTKKKRIITWIGSIALFVIVSMTIYKQFHAFLYDSYVEAIQEKDIEEGFSASLVDAYFKGINTIRMNVEYAKQSGISIMNLIFDFVRSTFGLHYFVKGNNYTISELYNLYRYGGEQSTGYLLSSIGYGYIVFGFILSPIVSVFNILVACFLERMMLTSHSIEWTYLFASMYMRFAYGMFGDPAPLLNFVTRSLIINSIIISVASVGYYHSKYKYKKYNYEKDCNTQLC